LFLNSVIGFWSAVVAARCSLSLFAGACGSSRPVCAASTVLASRKIFIGMELPGL